MAANTQNKGRSDARGAATGAASTADTGKSRPAPRQETGGTGTDAAASQETVAPSAIVVIAENPKRKGSKAFGFYQHYGPICQMTDVDACKTRGVRGKDLTWDAERGHILVGPAAEAFPISGSKEEQAQFLMGLSKNTDIPAEYRPHEYTEKELIKWGFLPEPAPVQAPTEGQTQNA
jgi:hypothetical protein